MATGKKRVKELAEKRERRASWLKKNKGDSKYALKLRKRNALLDGRPFPLMIGYSRPYGPMWLHRDQAEALNTPLARWDRPLLALGVKRLNKRFRNG